MRKENYSYGETTEVCPKTPLGYLELVSYVVSKQQLNCSDVRGGKKCKNQVKALEKALVICFFLSLRVTQLPHACIHMIKQDIFTFSLLLTGQLNKNISVHPITINS